LCAFFAAFTYFQVTLETAEVGFQLGRGLAAQIAVLLKGLVAKAQTDSDSGVQKQTGKSVAVLYFEASQLSNMLDPQERSPAFGGA
jgi:hypothetical protein